MTWFTQQAIAIKQWPLNIAQISDCHLLTNDGTYSGVDCAAYLRQVMIYLQRHHWDLVTVTGDITQDHTSKSYQLLADYCRVYLPDTPVAWLPGNHDEIDCLSQYLSQPPLTTAKHLIIDNWNIVMVNSKGPTPSGLVSAEQLSQLHDCLADISPTDNVAVFCHHHPLPVDGYIDKHMMSNGQQLLDLLKSFVQVKCISHGHVHQARETRIRRAPLATAGLADIVLWATPSTSIQFVVNSPSRADVDLGPALRHFQLCQNGDFNSRVIWLNLL